jgi:ADP-heptose:LPS heptosyltransferase
MQNGKPNPKNWPYWFELISLLVSAGHHIEQCGEEHDTRICGSFIHRISMETVIEDLNRYDLCLCVDTWLQHAAVAAGVPAVVIWTATNPEVFGNAANINVVAESPRFAKDQYAKMELIADSEPGQFPGPTPQQVYAAVKAALRRTE